MDFSYGIPQNISEAERRFFFRQDDDPDYGLPAFGDQTFIKEDTWKFLPATALVEIYKSLDDADRFRMSLVCQSWSELFCYPSLWRHREFRFGGIRSNRTDTWKSMEYVKKFGYYLQTLILTCEHPTQSVAKAFQKALNEITGTLTTQKCELREIYIPRLHLDRFWRVGVISNRLTKSLSRFLRKQHIIRVFDMSNAGLTLFNGLKILHALSAGCHYNRKMRELNIEDFFVPRLVIYRERQFIKSLACFRRLKSLSLNYNYINDDVLQTLTKTCGQSLRFMNIKVYRQDPNFHRIQSMYWRQLRRVTPKLLINVYFEGIGDFAIISRVLAPDMPVMGLQIWSGLHHQDEEWQLDKTLRYIGDCYAKTLDEISLGIETGREIVDDGLLYMLTKLKRLEDLDLHTTIGSPHTIEQICVMLMENKLGLLKCHINLEHLTGIEIEEVEEISENFEEMINNRGCDFHIEVNELILF